MSKKKKSVSSGGREGRTKRPKTKGVHGTASARRRIVIESFNRELDLRNSASTASKFHALVQDAASPRHMVVSADIDGLVSSAMIASVLPSWKVVAVVFNSQEIWVAPGFSQRPENVFGVDLFSTQFDNVSNHISLFGSRRIQNADKLTAFQKWDAVVTEQSSGRVFANPNIWACIEASYEDADNPRSAKYKYPFGTAQILLALLEVVGLAPRFYDRRYLPWLVANCDGGIGSFYNHGYNADIWWPTMAAAVGMGSLSEAVYARVSQMRPQDFKSEVNSLARELHANDKEPFLDDKWRLKGGFPKVWTNALRWLLDLTGWPDPVYGGRKQLGEWVKLEGVYSGKVALKNPSRPRSKTKEEFAKEMAALGKHDANEMGKAYGAVNANFYIGGRGDEGSRFNWIGGW